MVPIPCRKHNTDLQYRSIIYLMTTARNLAMDPPGPRLAANSSLEVRTLPPARPGPETQPPDHKGYIFQPKKYMGHTRTPQPGISGLRQKVKAAIVAHDGACRSLWSRSCTKVSRGAIYSWARRRSQTNAPMDLALRSCPAPF